MRDRNRGQGRIVEEGQGWPGRRRNWQIDKPIALVFCHQQHILLNWLFKIMPCLIIFRFTLPRSLLVQGFCTISNDYQLEHRSPYPFQWGPCLLHALLVWEQCWAMGDSWSVIILQHLSSTACSFDRSWDSSAVWVIRGDPGKADDSAWLSAFLWKGSISDFHRALSFFYTFLPSLSTEADLSSIPQIKWCSMTFYEQLQSSVEFPFCFSINSEIAKASGTN